MLAGNFAHTFLTNLWHVNFSSIHGSDYNYLPLKSFFIPFLKFVSTMSFLLRAKNRQRNRAAGPSNPLPRSKPATIGTPKPTATIRSYGSGQVQQLVQRQKPQLHQMSVQRNASKQQQKDLNQQAVVQEVISMEEGELGDIEFRRSSFVFSIRVTHVQSQYASSPIQFDRSELHQIIIVLYIYRLSWFTHKIVK